MLLRLFFIAILVAFNFSIYTAKAQPLSDTYVDEQYELDSDPFETMNRVIFGFNQTVDDIFLEPVARLYRKVVPIWGRDRIGNILSNMRAPVIFINNALQFDVMGMFTTFWRFFINTTVGIGGMYDVASADIGLYPELRDYDQTFARAGISSGPYLVLPILGSSTVRGLFGRILETVTDPFNYMTKYATISRTAAEIVDTRERFLNLTEEIKRSSFDPYATYRSAYKQNRRSFISHDN